MAEIFPLISCICMTNNRPAVLKRAIACYKSQNYPHKQLVVCYPAMDRPTKSILDSLSEELKETVLTIEQKGTLSAASILQLAISKSNGDFICLWHDSDWYHPSRLWFQYNSIQGTRYNASILTRFIVYDDSYAKAYVSSHYPLYGSLLCEKSIILSNPLESFTNAEDTTLFKFLNSDQLLFRIDDCAFLYAFVYHDKETRKFWDNNHILKHSELLKNELTKTIHELLDFSNYGNL